MNGRTDGGGSITLARGHTIERREVEEKLAEFRGSPMDDVLPVVMGAWEGVSGYVQRVDMEFFRDRDVMDRFEAALARKEWDVVDQLFLDGLKLDPARYDRFMAAETTMYAFSLWLCEEARESEHAHRWIDPPELESFLGGTFESRSMEDGTRRGFKALTVNIKLWFGRREIQVVVPVDRSIRQAIRCVRYTALPRTIEEVDERICDPKSAENADEAEARVPDGTPVPAGTKFVVLADAEVDEDVVSTLGVKYDVIRLDA